VRDIAGTPEHTTLEGKEALGPRPTRARRGVRLPQRGDRSVGAETLAAFARAGTARERSPKASGRGRGRPLPGALDALCSATDPTTSRLRARPRKRNCPPRVSARGLMPSDITRPALIARADLATGAGSRAATPRARGHRMRARDPSSTSAAGCQGRWPAAHAPREPA